MQSAVTPVYTKPISGGANEKFAGFFTKGRKVNYDEGNEGIVPYFVSGPLHREISIIGLVGGAMHVGAWVSALCFDLVIMDEIDMDTQKDSADFFYFSFWPFMVALSVVLLSTALHAADYIFSGRTSDNTRDRSGMFGWAKVPEGDFPPFLMSTITGANILSIFFTFLLLTSSAGSGLSGKAAEKWRRDVCFCLLSKFYIYTFIENNKLWAGPAPDTRQP